MQRLHTLGQPSIPAEREKPGRNADPGGCFCHYGKREGQPAGKAEDPDGACPPILPGQLYHCADGRRDCEDVRGSVSQTDGGGTMKRRNPFIVLFVHEREYEINGVHYVVGASFEPSCEGRPIQSAVKHRPDSSKSGQSRQDNTRRYRARRKP